MCCVALYTARDVLPGEELFVHYGDDKNRDYETGEKAPALYKYEIDQEELPANFVAGRVPMADGFRFR